MDQKIEFKKDNLDVEIWQDRKSAGESAASYVEKTIVEALQKKDELRIVFAAAPSQNEMLESLTTKTTIDWSRIVAFHMDEYIGLPPNSRQLFSIYLHNNLFSKMKFKNVNIINSQSDNIDKECARYSELLRKKEIDIVCKGIGENGHIAFNDPPVANFDDPKVVKVVKLDDKCRQQQVNDGCFATLNDVPQFAITLTIPSLLSAKVLSIVVLGKTKAQAVKRTLLGPISTECPASILRTHQHSKLFIDKDAYSLAESI